MGISIEIIEATQENECKNKEVAITCSYANNNSSLIPKAFFPWFLVLLFSVLRN